MPTRTVAAPTTDEDLQQWSRRFDLLADPNRLRILHHLHHEPDLCVSDLADAVGMRPAGAGMGRGDTARAADAVPVGRCDRPLVAAYGRGRPPALSGLPCSVPG